MIVYLVAAIADFLLAAIVLCHDRSRTAAAFAFLCLCMSSWTLELFFLASITDLTVLEPLFHGFRLGMFFMGPATYLFVTLITRTPITGWNAVGLATAFALGLAPAVMDQFLMPSRLLPVAKGHSPEFDLVVQVFYANLVVSSLASVYLCAKAYRVAIFRERLRIKWITFGVSIGVLCGWLHAAWPKLYIGVIGSILCLYFISYAVVRYRLISVRFAVGESVVSVAAAAPLVIAFILFDQMSATLGLKADGYIIAQVLLFFTLLQAYPWLVRYFAALKAKYFSQASVGYDFTRDWVLKALRECTSAAAFTRLCDEFFLRVIRVENYSFHLALGSDSRAAHLRKFIPTTMPHHPGDMPLSQLDDLAVTARFRTYLEALFYDEVEGDLKDDFASLQASALVPIRSRDETVGFVLLGAPTKPEQFSFDDIRLLNWFGAEVGPVLENLFAFMRLETSLTEAEKTLSVVSRLNEYNHDVKTPFSNIEALLLAGDAFSAEERQTRILEQVRRGHQLVATMTTLLRGGHKKRHGQVDLNAVIARVVASFPAHARQIEVATQPLPLFEGCEDELEILLSNLLSNALAARDKAEHRVRVWSWHDPDAGRIGCGVQDNGRGIAAERLAGLWQAAESDRRAQGGTGLGLVVVKRIVDDHGGRIVVSSEEGVGTEFSLSLPVSRGRARQGGARIRAV